MQMTIDEALRRGVEAHQTGQIQEADKYYTAILKSQPQHPDANHNLGLIAVSVNKIDEALPLFKTALEANPAIGQFWTSYIDTLINLKQTDEAKIALDDARING